MLKNYLKISLRNFRRHPGYASINIIGLGLGIGCCILALLFLRNEVTYDHFHENLDDIYRVTARFNKTIQFTVVPDPMVPAAVEDVPDIINGTRIWGSSVVVRHTSALYEQSANYVDASFFEMFSFTMRAGTQTFTSPTDVILTPALADKYFGDGDGDAIGQTLEMRLNDRFQVFTVIGVLNELPENSTLTFDMLLPFDQRYEIKEEDYRTRWGSYGVIGFIQLAPRTDTAVVSKQLLSLVEKHYGDTIREDGEEIEDYAFMISPFASHHLGGGGTEGYALKAGVGPAYVYLLSIIAVLVLLIACFNFMNLSVGQAASRLKEVGVRKVVGAGRNQLVFQFGFEALILSIIGALVGVTFVIGALPSFNYLTEAELIFQPLQQPVILGAIILVTLITVLFAGLYPAVILSNIKAIAAFRGRFRFGGANRFTQSFVVLQFSCTIIFLIGTVFISKQHSFMQEAPLGFDKEQVVFIQVNAPEDQPDTGERLLARFQESLVGHPTIRQVAGTSNAFTQGNSATMRSLEDGRQVILFTYRIDDQFIETLGMELIDGRNFNAEMPSDVQSGIIINEAFARVFEMDKPVGQVVPVELGDMEQPMIIGMVKDFHFQSLHTEIKPVFFHQRPPFKVNYLMAKIAPDQVQASIAALRETWAEFQPGYPFEYQFLDEVIDEQYKAEERWSLAMSYASWIAIFIACLGLLGLTSITMTRRTKEIGIRKVLGASIPGLVNLLSKEFLILVAIANLIAWPVAYLAISRWLEDFSYQIEMGVGVFFAAGIVTLGIALLTISYQSIRTASSDPVKSLKYE